MIRRRAYIKEETRGLRAVFGSAQGRDASRLSGNAVLRVSGSRRGFAKMNCLVRLVRSGLIGQNTLHGRVILRAAESHLPPILHTTVVVRDANSI